MASKTDGGKGSREAYWRGHVAACEVSGVSSAQYCREFAAANANSSPTAGKPHSCSETSSRCLLSHLYFTRRYYRQST